MATIDRGSRLTYAQLKAHFDGIALTAQQLADKIGDDFTSFITSGYTDNSVMDNVDISIDGSTTGLVAWSSVNAIGKVAPVLDAMRKRITSQTNAGTTAVMVALGYGEYVRSLMQTFSTSYDDTYTNFWTAFAALYTSGQYIPGEVVDIMNAVGIKVDPDYCYPPEDKLLADITFTDAATATLTTKDEIDPLLYNKAICSTTDDSTSAIEWYLVARNGSPDAITISMTGGRDEDDTPTDTGGTTFTFDVEAGETAAGTVGDVKQASTKQLCSVRDASLTITGGKASDQIAIRVKTLRSMANPT